MAAPSAGGSWLAETGLLLTDLYQLSMLQAYAEQGMAAPAAFEFFVRKLPAGRDYLVAAGLEQVVEMALGARFSEDELAWLADGGGFEAGFLDTLASLRFDGDVHAMPEGTVFFPDEPILRVVAPLPMAQLLETRIVNLLHFESLIATKAARMAQAAQGRTLIDFGLRRAHGVEAGLLAARASYIGGFTGTATVPAAKLWDIPIFGTMAHSFILAHDDESAAFEAFARSQPGNVVLLIDTYDTERGAEKVVALAPKLAADGIHIRGVRLDSGDLCEHAKAVRAILDHGGLEEVSVFASGGLDETAIADLLRAGAPIDGFGVGTSLTTSEDAPALDCAYKLQEYAGSPKRKRSEGKATWPGRKQVWRRFDGDGRMAGDVLTLEDAEAPQGTPLLAPVVRAGKRLAPPPSLAETRQYCAEQLSRLPAVSPYPVEVSQALADLAAKLDEEQATA